MTGADVIDQIKRLPHEERAKVIEYVQQADPLLLNPDELGEIARRMIETPDEAEAASLRDQFMRGFYGSKPPDA